VEEASFVRRYKAYDPPEYVDWQADAGLVADYAARLAERPERASIANGLDDRSLLELYRGLLRFRLHDIALKRWVKRGVISKAWLGTGEEAVTVGAVHALRRYPGGDVVAPMIRNAGACHEMGIPVADLLRSYLGTADSPTGGRDLHFGDFAKGVVAPISMVGSVSTVVNGYALAFRRRSEDRVAMTWIGDGSTKTGEVHEALNFAAVQRLPVVFVIQNNQVALGTCLTQHHRARDFSEWGPAYGMAAYPVDGNNVLDVYAAATLAVRSCREGAGPAMILAETFRMGGHATHDEREARDTIDPELFRTWGRRDPVGLYEEYLARLERRLLPGDGSEPSTGGVIEEWNRAMLRRIEEEAVGEVDAAEQEALESTEMPGPAAGPDEILGCYA
jgi:TPP-dependent pyruvate/acetoin dehydrogenase alpha subunit